MRQPPWSPAADRRRIPIAAPMTHDGWTALLQKAGVRRVRLHDGRHTAATLLLTNNGIRGW